MRISDWSSDVCSSDLPDVRPAEGERSRTALPVRRLDMLIGAIAVALDDASEVPEQLFRPDFPATRHVSVDDRRWIGAAMRAIITSDRPEISRLHLAGAGRQDRSEENTSELQ